MARSHPTSYYPPIPLDYHHSLSDLSTDSRGRPLAWPGLVDAPHKGNSSVNSDRMTALKVLDDNRPKSTCTADTAITEVSTKRCIYGIIIHETKRQFHKCDLLTLPYFQDLFSRKWSQISQKEDIRLSVDANQPFGVKELKVIIDCRAMQRIDDSYEFSRIPMLLNACSYFQEIIACNVFYQYLLDYYPFISPAPVNNKLVDIAAMDGTTSPLIEFSKAMQLYNRTYNGLGAKIISKFVRHWRTLPIRSLTKMKHAAYLILMRTLKVIKVERDSVLRDPNEDPRHRDAILYIEFIQHRDWKDFDKLWKAVLKLNKNVDDASNYNYLFNLLFSVIAEYHNRKQLLFCDFDDDHLPMDAHAYSQHHHRRHEHHDHHLHHRKQNDQHQHQQHSLSPPVHRPQPQHHDDSSEGMGAMKQYREITFEHDIGNLSKQMIKRVAYRLFYDERDLNIAVYLEFQRIIRQFVAAASLNNGYDILDIFYIKLVDKYFEAHIRFHPSILVLFGKGYFDGELLRMRYDALSRDRRGGFMKSVFALISSGTSNNRPFQRIYHYFMRIQKSATLEYIESYLETSHVVKGTDFIPFVRTFVMMLREDSTEDVLEALYTLLINTHLFAMKDDMVPNSKSLWLLILGVCPQRVVVRKWTQLPYPKRCAFIRYILESVPSVNGNGNGIKNKNNGDGSWSKLRSKQMKLVKSMLGGDINVAIDLLRVWFPLLMIEEKNWILGHVLNPKRLSFVELGHALNAVSDILVNDQSNAMPREYFHFVQRFTSYIS